MNKLVTVVVPIYKVEKYLDRCVSSILNQTYRNLEIILVDDGSPDRCPQMCDDYARKDPRIKVVHKENQGLGMARNTGIAHATGDYICFFDSDDFVEPDAIESCVTAACENEADLVVFGHDELAADQSLIATHLPNVPKHLFCGEEIQNKLLPMALYSHQSIGEDWKIGLSAWNKLYSMDVIKKTGWRFVSEREIISEDFYSLTELHGHLRRVCVIDRAYYHYMVNNGSLSRSFMPQRFEKIKLFYQAMDGLRERMGLAEVLEQPVKTIVFGLSIGAMKMIALADLKFSARYAEMKKMITDSMFQELIRTMDLSGFGPKKKLLYMAAKYKMVWLCFVLAYYRGGQKH